MTKTAFLRAALGALALAFLGSAQAGELESVSGFGDNPGNLKMYRYIPEGLPEGAPLVVAIHGCTQKPTDYDDEPGWLELADRYKFALMFPRQQESNQPLACYNVYQKKDIQRGKGEPASVISMVDTMLAEHKLDPKRVYVAGLSSGASMTAVMLATYPDRFAGGGIVGGVPYKCATDEYAFYGCMAGVNKSPDTWAKYVTSASDHKGPWPKVSIWHGDADDTVKIKNAEESTEQWTAVHGIAAEPTSTETVNGQTRQVYAKDGEPVVEFWTIKGMNHGSPINPGSAPDQCGKKSQYGLDVGVCSSYYMAKFWGIAP